MSNQKISAEYLKIHRHSKNVLIFFQIIGSLVFCAVLHPVFRNRLLLGSTTSTLASSLPFSCGFSVLMGMITAIMTRLKSPRAMIISNAICFLSLIIVLGLTFGIYKSIGNSSAESFQKEFLEVLNTHSEKGLKTLHKFQQSTQCCGVPLSNETVWNQTSISPNSPLASWFFYTMLDEEYIDEARVSIKPSSKDVIIDELVEIQHRLRKSKKSEDARQSVNENSCEPPEKVLLDGVPTQLFIVGAGFGWFNEK
ncbi:hypothetical protein CRE_01614 [Caenorhabditis remanei]|uniref:Uncharacterized protein n=1 Tax=Caenorhabditis remanei TaxID=31234 RepID=E3LGS7_CAERE|nr:hypothetical protein CRE_01614 [Caenorhabditis remanei]